MAGVVDRDGGLACPGWHLLVIRFTLVHGYDRLVFIRASWEQRHQALLCHQEFKGKSGAQAVDECFACC